ncbi:hypothetical protein, partial [Rubrivirga sp.]|uniref:hypothetical protein n=1 Tax=Rubrivirga sp. TaxID=1885344 RepID=UPI003C7888B3
ADTFEVTVLDPCPASVQPGHVDVFPIEVGARWSYDVEASENPTGRPATRELGTAALEVVSAGACDRGARAFAVRERVSLVAERYDAATDSWVVTGSPSVDRTVAWTVTDSLVTTDAPPFPGGRAGLRPLAPFGQEIPRFAEAGTISLFITRDSFLGPSIVLEAGVGPVSYWTRTNFGTVGSGFVRWTQIE